MSGDSVVKYRAALALERDRSAEVSLIEYRIVIEAAALSMLHPNDPNLQILRKLVSDRDTAIRLLTEQMAKVVEASKAAREEFGAEVVVDVEDNDELH